MIEPAVLRAPARSTPWHRRLGLLDSGLLVVALLAAATEGVSIVLGQSGGGFAALFVSAAGVLLGRRVPWLGLVLTSVAPLTAAVLGFEPIALWTIAVFTCCSVALKGRSAIGVSLTAAVPVYLAIVVAGQTGFVNSEAFTAVALIVAASMAGSALHSRQDYWDEQAARAQDAALARDREIEARVTEERLRIARDLHDVVGHEVASLGIHLGVLEVSLPEDAVQARLALGAARAGVKSVLQETQRILRVLRTEDDAVDATSPAPSYDGIARLVDGARATGTEIEGTLCEPPDRIDPEVGSAAFRIVQELLTNFRRHGCGTLRLSTGIEQDVLRIEAWNDVAAIAPGSMDQRGYGLTGMRERAASAGGSLVIMRTTDIFTAEARLPLNGRRP